MTGLYPHHRSLSGCPHKDRVPPESKLRFTDPSRTRLRLFPSPPPLSFPPVLLGGSRGTRVSRRPTGSRPPPPTPQRAVPVAARLTAECPPAACPRQAGPGSGPPCISDVLWDLRQVTSRLADRRTECRQPLQQPLQPQMAADPWESPREPSARHPAAPASAHMGFHTWGLRFVTFYLKSLFHITVVPTFQHDKTLNREV